MQAQPLPPPLVDASDLLSDPPQVIQKFCAAIGVPFDESMLSWKSGKVEAFSSWQGYHTAAENSTGFKKETPVLSEAEQAALKVQRRSSSSSDASSSSSHSADSVSEAVGDKKVSQIPQDVLDTIRYVISILPFSSLIPASPVKTWMPTIICMLSEHSQYLNREFRCHPRHKQK